MAFDVYRAIDEAAPALGRFGVTSTDLLVLYEVARRENAERVRQLGEAKVPASDARWQRAFCFASAKTIAAAKLLSDRVAQDSLSKLELFGLIKVRGVSAFGTKVRQVDTKALSIAMRNPREEESDGVTAWARVVAEDDMTDKHRARANEFCDVIWGGGSTELACRSLLDAELMWLAIRGIDPSLVVVVTVKGDGHNTTTTTGIDRRGRRKVIRDCGKRKVFLTAERAA